jgi:tetratricopeptide (TPR) repeat protein
VQDAYDRAISFLRPLTENHPELPEYRHELAAALNNMGNLLATADRFEEAQKMHALAKARFAVLAADFPNVPIYRQELANTCNSIGNVAYLRMDYEGALSNWSESRKVIEGLLEKHPGMLAYQGDLGMAHLNLGLAQHKLGQHSQARAHLEKSIEILEKVIGGGPVSYQKTLQFSYHNLAEVLVVSGDHAAAATAARQLASASPPSADHPYNAACFLARCIPLAECDKKLSPEKQRELAQSYAEASIAAIRDALDRGFNNAEKIRTDQATVLKPIASRPDFRALIQQIAGN